MKRQEETPDDTIAIKSYQKIVDDLTAAREKKTPHGARLIQHDKGLKQLEWDKSANEASLKTSTENRKFYEAEEEELRQKGEEMENKIILAQKAKKLFYESWRD